MPLPLNGRLGCKGKHYLLDMKVNNEKKGLKGLEVPTLDLDVVKLFYSSLALQQNKLERLPLQDL